MLELPPLWLGVMVTACAFILVYILNSLIFINIFTHRAKPSIITYCKQKVNLRSALKNEANLPYTCPTSNVGRNNTLKGS